jgi:uncharacterized protein YbbC (DUF1343 family)
MKEILIPILVLIFITVSYSQPQNVIQVKTGMDVLIENNFDSLARKKISLLTNFTGRTNKGTLSAEVFLKTKICTLVKIFTPEHGFYTTVPAGENVSDDNFEGIPILSLYGNSRKPSKEQLKQCDAIVVDLQDIGIRPYTYISSVYNLMDACSDAGIPIYILDRPNPLGGMVVDGNVVEKDKESFIGIAPLPYVHGCTIGELAEMFNGEGWLPNDKNGIPKKCDLHIIKMQNWKRVMWWEDTGLEWYPTSPHIPTVDAARGAAMLGAWGELSLFSIGIGTTLPFQYAGSPNFNTDAILKQLNGSMSGVQLLPTKYNPSYGMYNGKNCNGFLLKFTPDNLFQPYTNGIRLVLAIRSLYPSLFNKKNFSAQSRAMFTKATGTDEIFDLLMDGKSDFEILDAAKKGLDNFLKIRAKYLLYE